MYAFKSGDVVVIPFFPHQDNPQQGEPRWVIIVEDLGDEYCIVPLTKQTHQKNRYTKCIDILCNSEEGKTMKLTNDSIIVCDRMKSVKKITFSIPPCYLAGQCSEQLIDDILSM